MTISLTEDLWTLILSRLPLKSIATSKLVCKHWKSIAESQFLRKHFLSHHQNSHSSWSVMWRDGRNKNAPEEVVAHYGCDVWGLPRSLGSYVSSFINSMTTTKTQEVRVLAYTEVGLILIIYYFNPTGLVTRIENGELLGYKVVLMDSSKCGKGVLSLLIYSSETCKWSFKTLRSSLPLSLVYWQQSVSMSGNLHWAGTTADKKYAIVSHDFYATGTESDRCRVTINPDVENFKDDYKGGVWTSSQGFLMLMNILEEDKLKVWRLKSGEWEHVSQISSVCFKPDFNDIFPLAMNRFDGETLYLSSENHKRQKRKRLVSTNLYNKGKLGLHNKLERTSDGLTLSFTMASSIMERSIYDSELCTFVLPRWLYRIPSSPS
ncbi:F-box protein At3g28330 [Eutrema salsugineum]|uniref:F-box protein At3g28330 n=1 Tax=Eutrema salsugineum TaxID=72664 RepID=UPI000CED59AD|nr:F-box protein At3g28330 [Eutrema salsugineum]